MPMEKLQILIVLIFLSIQSIAQSFDGYALYNNLGSKTTYLIDRNEDIAHTWSLPTSCNYAVLLKEDGNIIRGSINNFNQISGAAVGGKVEEYDPFGNLVWSFTYSSSNVVAHHDISRMPNDNVLMIAWEVINSSTLQANGYTDNELQRYATHFIEVSQIEGTQQGEIVWEWHIFDHLVQDVDANKPNFGVIKDHPELLDINVETDGGSGGTGPFGGGGGDWFHVNGIDYNQELDLIAFSSRFLNEVFIIDHSTTIAEAAGHSGGNFGKGGDFLYRYGKPSNYNTSGPQVIGGPVHDARWVPDDGRPRGGYLQFFNNEGLGNKSTVDAIALPWNADNTGFEKNPGQQFQPSSPTWRHECFNSADGQSAANSLPNGNIFVALSGGYMYEADLNGNTVWQYPDGPAKAFRYTCDYPGVQALINQGIIEDLCMISNIEEIPFANINLAPNPTSGLIEIQGLADNDQAATIRAYDNTARLMASSQQSNFVDLTGLDVGIYYITVTLANGKSFTRKVSLTD